MYFRVPRRRRSCPGAAKEPEWAAGTRRHRRDDSSSVAHRAKEEVSSRVAASPRRIGSADPSSRLGSWSRVAPRLPQKTLKSRIYLTRRNKPAAQSMYRSSRIFVISARRVHPFHQFARQEFSVALVKVVLQGIFHTVYPIADRYSKSR